MIELHVLSLLIGVSLGSIVTGLLLAVIVLRREERGETEEEEG